MRNQDLLALMMGSPQAQGPRGPIGPRGMGMHGMFMPRPQQTQVGGLLSALVGTPGRDRQRAYQQEEEMLGGFERRLRGLGTERAGRMADMIASRDPAMGIALKYAMQGDGWIKMWDSLEGEAMADRAGNALQSYMEAGKKPDDWTKVYEHLRESGVSHKYAMAGVKQFMDAMQAHATLRKTESEIAENEADAAAATGGVKDSTLTTMAGQYNMASKDFQKVKRHRQNIVKLKEEDTPISDVGLVFNIMKMYDPTSVVREGEQATAKSAGAVPDRVRNLYNYVVEGEKLTPAQREEFFSAADVIYRGYLPDQIRLQDEYAGRAMRRGADPRDVVIDLVGEDAKMLEDGNASDPGKSLAAELRKRFPDRPPTAEQAAAVAAEMGFR